jgi:aryl-alcohol dehydrogenase-like predicted oxidoreductase
MDVRKVGGTGLIASAIGIGCMAFTGAYGRIGQAESVRRIRQALDIGISMIDMSDFYSGGRVEQLAGRAIKGRRQEAVIATRGGLRFTTAGRPTVVDGRPEYLRRACDASLRRLGTDNIDLYYLAGVDRSVPIEESVGQLAELAAAGKIRYIGVATKSAQELRRAHGVHPVSAVSAAYSLWERRAEHALLPAARERSITLVSCSPLGQGLLSGRITSTDESGNGQRGYHGPPLSASQLASMRKRLRVAEDIAASMHLSLGRLALAWLLFQADVIPVPSTRSALHLEMNAAAADVGLPAAEWERLGEVFAPEGSGGDG